MADKGKNTTKKKPMNKQQKHNFLGALLASIAAVARGKENDNMTKGQRRVMTTMTPKDWYLRTTYNAHHYGWQRKTTKFRSNFRSSNKKKLA